MDKDLNGLYSYSYAHHGVLDKMLDGVGKKLKALEIIKSYFNYKVEEQVVNLSKDPSKGKVHLYYLVTEDRNELISKEEYDLLKEILKDEQFKAN